MAFPDDICSVRIKGNERGRRRRLDLLSDFQDLRFLRCLLWNAEVKAQGESAPGWVEVRTGVLIR
jgi:hypothetical protein